MAAVINKIFRRKKAIPLACSVSIENEPGHVHTSACFIDIQPLSVVELFQSQGCVSCPPAVPKILESTTDHNLLLLSYDVTYFDHLGWTDTFGDGKWDKRQKDYVRKWGRTSIFTPQVVVDGVADGTGSGNGEVNEIVAGARESRKQMPWHIVVDTNDTELRIDSDGMEAGTFDICLISYDPNYQVVKIGKGPNKGKKVPHRNLVKDVIKIGEWTGGNLTVPLPDRSQMIATGLQTVAVVQGGMGGPIVAAQKL
ncbi:hypothetical protein D0Z07_6616 [Hyphodiscus hymeniophilus]|uniref:DUF1223-domain-containing protein n=1 Tax=Hyphodiscus hymeniophilus TaxID=353542 RepID=A0A9P6VGY7_9HELO|nr:hypothetical protein D0Z07_6616 [Hyphodiscus hymeniophilus]